MTKLLVLAVIIALVWFGFKWAGRVSRQRSGGEVPRDDSARAALDSAEDLSKCSVCGTFVPVDGARDCGREKCPYPG